MSTGGWPAVTMATAALTGRDEYVLVEAKRTETMSGGYGHNDAGDGRQKLKNTELSDGVDATTRAILCSKPASQGQRTVCGVVSARCVLCAAQE
jgi:hypothetical protein